MTINSGYRLEPVVDASNVATSWNVERRDGNLWTLIQSFPKHQESDAISLLRKLVTGRDNTWEHRNWDQEYKGE